MPPPAVGSGGGGAAAEANSIRDFLMSHDAVMRADERINLVEIWQRPEADWIAQLWHDDPERLTKYYNNMVSVSFDSSTGVVALRVRSFRPEDSRRLTETLLALSESLGEQPVVERAREDAPQDRPPRGSRSPSTAVQTARDALASFPRAAGDLDSAGTAQAAQLTISQMEARWSPPMPSCASASPS